MLHIHIDRQLQGSWRAEPPATRTQPPTQHAAVVSLPNPSVQAHGSTKKPYPPTVRQWGAKPHSPLTKTSTHCSTGAAGIHAAMMQSGRAAGCRDSSLQSLSDWLVEWILQENVEQGGGREATRNSASVATHHPSSMQTDKVPTANAGCSWEAMRQHGNCPSHHLPQCLPAGG